MVISDFYNVPQSLSRLCSVYPTSTIQLCQSRCIYISISPHQINSSECFFPKDVNKCGKKVPWDTPGRCNMQWQNLGWGNIHIISFTFLCYLDLVDLNWTINSILVKFWVLNLAASQTHSNIKCQPRPKTRIKSNTGKGFSILHLGKMETGIYVS